MLTFQKRISNVTEDDNIAIDLIVNLDQTLFAICLTFNASCAKTARIKGINDKH